MTILVTGAAGFVGRALTQRLANTFPQSEIIALSRETQMVQTPQNVTYHCVNLAKDSLESLFKAHNFTFIFHLAAHSSVGQAFEQASLTFGENIRGCLNLAQAIQRFAPNAHLIFASSSEVYGRSFNLQNPISENAPPDPQNPYARSKLAGEFLFQDMLSARNKVTLLRLFNHFGAGQDARFVIPNFAAQLREMQAKQKPAVIKVGNLTAVRDFLPLNDVLAAYLAVIQQPKAGLYNVCSGEGRSIASVLDDLIAISGLDVHIEQDESRMRPSEIPIAVGQSTRFSTNFNWQPKSDWNSALKEFFK